MKSRVAFQRIFAPFVSDAGAVRCSGDEPWKECDSKWLAFVFCHLIIVTNLIFVDRLHVSSINKIRGERHLLNNAR